MHIKVFVSTPHNHKSIMGGRLKSVFDPIWRSWEIALMKIAKLDLAQENVIGYGHIEQQRRTKLGNFRVS